MANFVCPKCGKPLRRFARRDNPELFFWSCSGYYEGCDFICDDFYETPYQKRCAECGKYLIHRKSKKTGKYYSACFNKEGHASHNVIFYNEDGSLPGAKDAPEAKGQFTCSECGQVLAYRKIRRGKYAGTRNIFVCNNISEHKNGKPRFYNDLNGTPMM